MQSTKKIISILTTDTESVTAQVANVAVDASTSTGIEAAFTPISPPPLSRKQKEILETPKELQNLFIWSRRLKFSESILDRTQEKLIQVSTIAPQGISQIIEAIPDETKIKEVAAKIVISYEDLHRQIEKRKKQIDQELMHLQGKIPSAIDSVDYKKIPNYEYFIETATETSKEIEENLIFINESISLYKEIIKVENYKPLTIFKSSSYHYPLITEANLFIERVFKFCNKAFDWSQKMQQVIKDVVDSKETLSEEQVTVFKKDLKEYLTIIDTDFTETKSLSQRICECYLHYKSMESKFKITPHDQFVKSYLDSMVKKSASCKQEFYMLIPKLKNSLMLLNKIDKSLNTLEVSKEVSPPQDHDTHDQNNLSPG